MKASDRAVLVFASVAILLVLAPFFLRLPLIETRGYNPDELEHLHFSWCVWRGLVPYVDYFEHHTPWFHFFLAQFFDFYDVERLPEDALGFTFMARYLMWLAAGATLGLTFLLGRSWRDARTGLVAAFLLGNTAFFLAKSFEIRPAVPAAALLLLSVWLALLGTRRAVASEPGGRTRLLVSGLALGAAVMITQKVLFVGPGYAAVVFWLLLDRRLELPRATRFGHVAVISAGFALPVAGTLGYFALHGAAWAFIDANLIVNTRWPGLPAGPFLVELARQDPFFVMFVVAGFLLEAKRALTRKAVLRGDPIVTFATLSVTVSLAAHPAMSHHHFLLILPLASLYGALGLLRIVESVTNYVRGKALLAAATVALGALGFYGLSRLAPPELVLPVFAPFVLGAFTLALGVCLWRGSREAALTIIVVLLSAYPLTRLRNTFDRGNWGTTQAIEYVLRNSAPWETTFDGFTGLGLFRPQAFFHHFHHFQHPHAFKLQSKEEHKEMYEALRNGRAMPKFIFWSHYLRDAVTPEITAFLQEHYVPTGLEPIRVLPFDNGAGWWSDEKTRYIGWVSDEDEAPHVLFDDGWRPPSEEFGLPIRRTRTRRSTLTVPIRYPRDFNVTLRAHADSESVPFGVELVVNGRSAGRVDAVPRWQDYAFPVTVHQLLPGFNELQLRFSAEHGDPSKRLELAVQAEAVSRDEQPSARTIPDGEGEHSIEIFDAFVAELFIRVNDGLGVAARVEAMTQLLQTRL